MPVQRQQPHRAVRRVEPTKATPSRRKTTTGAAKKQAHTADHASTTSYPKTVDSSKVTRPVDEYVHKNLVEGWKINNDFPMWFIFDAVSPAMEFKRGVPFDQEQDFPEYGSEPCDDITESDGESPGYMPFNPPLYERKYHFRGSILYSDFLNWNEGDIRSIEYGKPSKKRKGKGKKRKGKRNSFSISWKTAYFPAPYHRLIVQLIAEDEHAYKHDSHEALRRQYYATRTLDALGAEFDSWKGDSPMDFRSKVLTPILQRQLWGIYDGYGPSVREAIPISRSATPNSDEDEPTITILDATKFYLSEDPVDPALIPNYRRNLIYIPEARWHLGVMMGKHEKVGTGAYYNKVRDNHDRIINALDEEDDSSEEGIALLRPAEVEAIFDEELEDFFRPELARVPNLLTDEQIQRMNDTESDESESNVDV